MKPGYYWYRVRDDYGSQHGGPPFGPWMICWVKGGFVHFFGQVSQEVGNEYLTKYVEFGPEIIDRPL